MSFITVTVKRSADGNFFNVKMVASDGQKESCRRSAKNHNFDAVMIEEFVCKKFHWNEITEVRYQDSEIILMDAVEAAIPEPQPERESVRGSLSYKGYDFTIFYDPSEDNYTFSVDFFEEAIECIAPSATEYGAKEAAIRAIDGYIEWEERCKDEAGDLDSAETQENSVILNGLRSVPCACLEDSAIEMVEYMTSLNKFLEYQLEELLRNRVHFTPKISSEAWANYIINFSVKELEEQGIKRDRLALWYANNEWHIKTGHPETTVQVSQLLESTNINSVLTALKDILIENLHTLLSNKFDKVLSTALQHSMVVDYAYNHVNGSQEITENNRWDNCKGVVIYLPDAIRNDVRAWWLPSIDSTELFFGLVKKQGIPQLRKGDRVQVLEGQHKGLVGQIINVAPCKYQSPNSDWSWKISVDISRKVAEFFDSKHLINRK